MPSNAEWSDAYWVQAHSDLKTWELLREKADSLDYCHELHYLQMMCEKLCKAHLYAQGDISGEQTSHKFVGKALPVLLSRLCHQLWGRLCHQLWGRLCHQEFWWTCRAILSTGPIRVLAIKLFSQPYVVS